MRILVVDDNADFLRAARFLLKQLGHEPVGLARSGDEGLALAAGLDPGCRPDRRQHAGHGLRGDRPAG